ncbi:MAG: HEAT repeat domain-containing protein, partial [Planctomycetota bacterium]
LNEILATKRLQAAAEREQEKEKAADPAKKNAEVVELAAGAGTPARAQEKANPAPQQAGASPALPGAVAGTPDSGQENSASAADEAVLEERYQAGLAARDVVAREASFQQAAIQRREDAIPFLLEELRQNNLLAALAVDCLGAIGRLTEEVEAGLLHGLASRETAVRQTCAYTLAKLRSQHAVQPLIEALKTEKNYPVRCAYLAALGGLGDREALPALKAKLAQQDEVEFVKSAAALALARLGDPAGRAHLVHDLQAPEPSLQVVGLEGLAQLNEPGIAGYLNMGLESPYEEVWTTAAFLMPQLGPGEALPVLRTRLDSPSETIRRRAALAMGFVGSDEALPLIERAVRVGGLNERVMGCALLSNLGRTDQVPLLLEKLQDPHTSVRQTAAVSLARLGAKESVPALLEAARGLKSAGGLPPGLRGAGPDAGERLVLLSCARYLRGEKKDLAISSLPNLRDNTWPEVDRALAEQQVELVKLYQFVDVVADGARALGVVLKPPEGKEQMFREGEHVASGFKVREIGLPIEGKDKAKMPPYVILMRGADRIILAPGRPAEVDVNRQ